MFRSQPCEDGRKRQAVVHICRLCESGPLILPVSVEVGRWLAATILAFVFANCLTGGEYLILGREDGLNLWHVRVDSDGQTDPQLGEPVRVVSQ